jgi:UPF0271 protein
MFKVDLNSDLGESFGNYTIGMDQDIIPFVSSVNIACGWHAGDPLVMNDTVMNAIRHHVAIGAHPGYPDLMGFGRRNMTVTPAEVKAYTIYQIGALLAFVIAHGGKLQHVKPHGAMYNMAATDAKLALAIAEGIKAVAPEVILLGLANSEMIRAGRTVGLKVAQEVFADRAYQLNGTLVPRSQPGAVIHNPDAAIERVVRMVKEGKVETITGEDIEIQADSICVHGDNPEAVAFVSRIRETLVSEGVEIVNLDAIVK